MKPSLHDEPIIVTANEPAQIGSNQYELQSCESGTQIIEKDLEKNGEIIYSFDMEGSKNPEAIAKAGLLVIHRFIIAKRFENGKVAVTVNLSPNVTNQKLGAIADIKLMAMVEYATNPNQIVTADHKFTVSSALDGLEAKLNDKGFLDRLRGVGLTSLDTNSFSNLSEALGYDKEYLATTILELITGMPFIKSIQKEYEDLVVENPKKK
jgi:hypothetical protein